ncbi:MAG: hypothetical protein H6828_09880 [Planctomycetes bacterium]|nr:hypothetical protein [Planctomycetota bacterium]
MSLLAFLGLPRRASSEAPPAPPAPVLLEGTGETRFRTQVLGAWDAQVDDWFGAAVALDGGRLVVGLPYDDISGGNSGSAATFELGPEGWRQIDLIAPTTGGRDHYFGMAVALDGDRLVVGAPWNDERADQAGAVFVFEWDGAYWNQAARLYAEDARAGDNLGVSVALDGTRLAVGARFGGAGTRRTGAVYVFELDHGRWRQHTKLDGASSAEGDEFGFALDLLGDRLAVGAYAAGESRGEVRVYEREAARWREAVRLTAPEPQVGACFGLSVALAGDQLLVGAPWEDGAGRDSGAVHLYERGFRAWRRVASWTQPGARGGEYFGCAVALSDAAALVGARYGGTEPVRSGAAFLSLREGADWGPLRALPRPLAVAEDDFGLAVALDGAHAVVGARQVDPQGIRNGKGMCRWYDPFPGK